MTQQQSLIVFDGVCVLCSHFFRFVLARDKAQVFQFATAQSEAGQKLYRDLGLPVDAFETFLVIDGGTTYQRLDGFCAIVAQLGGLWPMLGWMRILPRSLKNMMYGVIAKNRFRLFGRRDTCLVPSVDVRDRFVSGGWT